MALRLALLQALLLASLSMPMLERVHSSRALSRPLPVGQVPAQGERLSHRRGRTLRHARLVVPLARLHHTRLSLHDYSHRWRVGRQQ